MRVLSLTTGSDTAGSGIAIKRAFDRHAPDWTVNSLVASQNYIGYPVDPEAQPEPGIVGGLPYATRYQMALERLYDAADVVHIHSTTHAHRWYDNGQGKPTVLMLHGMHSLPEYRANAEDGRRIGATLLGSTLDLSVLEPDVEWLPLPVDLVRMREIRNENFRPHHRIRVGHAPTNRAIKGSDAFDAAMGVLYALNLAEPVVIQGKSWADCLALKATCDLFYDQPVLGYGSNAIEAWAMGIPVIAGVASPEVREAMLARWGVLPFAEATDATLSMTESSLSMKLRALVSDEDLRREYAARGTAHVECWHDERRTVRELRRIYASAGPTVPGGSEKRLSAVSLAKIARVQAQDRRAGRLVRA